VGVHEEAGPVSPSATPDPAPLLEALGVEVSLEVLERALTHSSYAYEQEGSITNASNSWAMPCWVSHHPLSLSALP